MFQSRFSCWIPVIAALALPCVAFSQTPAARRLIVDRVDASRLTVLAGNTRSQATARNDAGRVADDFAMDHMLLQLQRPAERQQALDQLIDQLHDPNSPNFHQWLTAEELGRDFGPAPEDIAAVTGWLQSQGFEVNAVYPSGMVVDFSGTAGHVRQAFHTEIHRLLVGGEEHIANMSDPAIPAALAPAVVGVVSMHDFRPRAMKKARPEYTFTSGGATYQAVVPGDLATIYNLNSLFTANPKITGAGQTIAVLEDTDLYSTADWTTFRTTFGLSQYTSGSLTTVHPAPKSGTNNCADPGVPSGGDDGEAILDAEWASAAAPGAAIQVASCADTRTTFGGLIALQNMLNSAKPPQIVSISYGECEAENGTSANATYNSAYQQAAAMGTSVFVAAGDEGAASCDAGATGATHGIGVSAFASTPYNVAVGGTDFGDTYNKSNALYWNATNTSTYASAKSYVPEIPWNDSCASTLLASVFGFKTTFGSSGFCGSTTASSDGLLEVVAGSGGPSGCATGSPATTGVVNGTCKGYTKPTWQALNGVPGDGVRDIPDVSLFAGNGIWGHYYVFCWSNRRAGGAACTGAPSTWSGAGGTSFASPIMAGIQALVNQKTNTNWGSPNTVYYQMARLHQPCNSSSGNGNPSTCIFYNVTQGDIDVNCSGTVDCYGATSGGRRATPNGALSTSSSSDSPAYPTGSGWNFAAGIGSVNAYNLVMNWGH